MFCCSLQDKDIKRYIKNMVWMFDKEKQPNTHICLKLNNTNNSILCEQIPEISEWENISTPRCQ